MKIGYTIYKEEIKRLKEAGATSIVLNDDLYNGNQQFIDFLKANQEHEVFLVGLQSISSFISTIQLFTILELVKEQKRQIHFIDKGTDTDLSDNDYLDILWQIASYEKVAVSNRVRRGMERSKERGTPRGRPSLDDELIQKIRKLKINEKKSIREIATLCEVSIGSVHKYVQEITAENVRELMIADNVQ